MHVLRLALLYVVLILSSCSVVSTMTAVFHGVSYGDLVTAISNGNKDLVHALLDDVKTVWCGICPELGTNPLHHAAMSDDVEFLQIVFDKCGGTPLLVHQDLTGQTPIHIAALAQKYKALEWLAEQEVGTFFNDLTDMHGFTWKDSYMYKCPASGTEFDEWKRVGLKVGIEEVAKFHSLAWEFPK